MSHAVTFVDGSPGQRIKTNYKKVVIEMIEWTVLCFCLLSSIYIRNRRHQTFRCVRNEYGSFCIDRFSICVVGVFTQYVIFMFLSAFRRVGDFNRTLNQEFVCFL